MANDPHSSGGPGLRAWFQRLGQALSGEPRDREELPELLNDAHERNLFDADAQTMVEAELQVADRQVRDVMAPRAQMTALAKDASLEEALKVVSESGHSRFPVVGEDRDQVTGIVLAKDLLNHFFEGGDTPF